MTPPSAILTTVIVIAAASSCPSPPLKTAQEAKHVCQCEKTKVRECPTLPSASVAAVKEEAPVVYSKRRASTRRCTDGAPSIEPVSSTKVKGGLFFDDRAVSALATNELAWRAWLDKVQRCEEGR